MLKKMKQRGKDFLDTLSMNLALRLLFSSSLALAVGSIEGYKVLPMLLWSLLEGWIEGWIGGLRMDWWFENG